MRKRKVECHKNDGNLMFVITNGFYCVTSSVVGIGKPAARPQGDLNCRIAGFAGLNCPNRKKFALGLRDFADKQANLFADNSLGTCGRTLNRVRILMK